MGRRTLFRQLAYPRLCETHDGIEETGSCLRARSRCRGLSTVQDGCSSSPDTRIDRETWVDFLILVPRLEIRDAGKRDQNTLAPGSPSRDTGRRLGDTRNCGRWYCSVGRPLKETRRYGHSRNPVRRGDRSELIHTSSDRTCVTLGLNFHAVYAC